MHCSACDAPMTARGPLFDGRTLCPRCVDTLRGLAVGAFDVDTLARTYQLPTDKVDRLRQLAAQLATISF